MSYRGLWLKGDEIVAEARFADLLEAKDHILKQLRFLHRADVTAIRVVARGRTCFEVRPAT